MMDKVITIFNRLTNLQRILSLIILGIVLYGLSVSLSYFLFSQIKPISSTKESLASLPTPSNAFVEDPNDPKTESCPLNGVKRTKKARDFWERRRPLAVMIENHTEARPQSGLSSADVVYEAIAEGGITRFMALFYCNL